MRWIIRFFMFLVVVAGVAIVGLLMIPGEKIAQIAKEQFEAATGRPIEISADVSTTIWPVLGVRTGRVEIANAPWSDNGPMLAADELLVGVNALSLLSGNIDIRRIEAISPEVLLEVRSDGTPNWAFEGVAPSTGSGETSTSTGASIPAFTVGKGIVSSGGVRWLDHQTGTDVTLSNVNMELQLPSFEGEGSVHLEMSMNGVSQVLDAKIAEFGPFLNGAVSNLSADVSIGGSTAGFQGRGGWMPLALDGAVTADLDDMASVYKIAGQTPVSVPRGFGQAIAVKGNFTLTPEKTVHLRGATLTLDQNTFSGDVDVNIAGNRPNIQAQLSAGDLDFSSLAASEKEGGTPATGAAGGTGWSRDVIDASFLSTANARIGFAAQSIDLGTLKLGPTRASATLDNSRIEFDIAQIAAYQGNVSGNFVMNNRSGLSIGGNLNFAQLALQPALRDLAGYERLIGTADFQMRFLGVGNTMHAIMNSLSGGGSFAIGQGELRGLDLAGMLRNFDLSFEGEGKKTIFDSAGASFTMDGGVLRNDDLAFVADRIRADGAGVIGIGTQTLDYRVTPAVALGDGGITIPVIIEGTWADPKFRPDLQAIIDQNLAEEKAALEARLAEERAAAEARLEQERAELEARAAEKLEQELGVTREEGEDLEDTLRRGLENEAKDALRGLLGGN
ncbi:AsmA family protein [Halocynthiibacter namhaensis]|uniref:AsmA family protein n=1 Tax=Halocynthiibacter namhaensis TaxID=1290553 RepID=UPI00057985A3|nr:AsmA family protein [Halocynthiibacter namhaensis]